jgi:hypothetical protein
MGVCQGSVKLRYIDPSTPEYPDLPIYEEWTCDKHVPTGPGWKTCICDGVNRTRRQTAARELANTIEELFKIKKWR